MHCAPFYEILTVHCARCRNDEVGRILVTFRDSGLIVLDKRGQGRTPNMWRVLGQQEEVKPTGVLELQHVSFAVTPFLFLSPPSAGQGVEAAGRAGGGQAPRSPAAGAGQFCSHTFPFPISSLCRPGSGGCRKSRRRSSQKNPTLQLVVGLEEATLQKWYKTF